MRHLLSTFAVAAALTATGVTPAVAAERTPAATAVASCYGGAVYFDAVLGAWPRNGKDWAYTTSRCADINVKPNKGSWASVCFKATATCNGRTWAAAGQWTVVATNVKDGTGFYLAFQTPVDGYAAY
ncbi:hypothetical protein [Streptomyces sp. NPDC088762]|uniref:hypothetical protein n=1 Tax=Streptomyces sp. NPDC088762 TaxID=3365891 RepID=UPI00381C4221